MKKRHHTAGPLKVVRTGDRVEIADRESGSVLAEVFGDDKDPQCWPVTANANLFAAAPRMFEALQQAAHAIPTTHGAFKTVRKAIAAASGKE